MITMPKQVRGRPLPYLQAWRLQRLMTQAELIQRSGLGRATVVRAERGDEIVTMANIRKLAEALGISPDELVYTDPDASANS